MCAALGHTKTTRFAASRERGTKRQLETTGPEATERAKSLRGFALPGVRNPSHDKAAVRYKHYYAIVTPLLPDMFNEPHWKKMLDFFRPGRAAPMWATVTILAMGALLDFPDVARKLVLKSVSHRSRKQQAIVDWASARAAELENPEATKFQLSITLRDRVDQLEHFIDTHPTWCSSLPDIVARFRMHDGSPLSLAMVRHAFKQAERAGRAMKKLPVKRQPRLMQSVTAEAYAQYMIQMAFFAPNHVILFYDQFPCSTEAGKGSSSAQKARHSLWATQTTQHVQADGRYSPGKTFQMSILISNRQILKVWPHGLTKMETGINKQGGTMDGTAVKFFFLETQTVPQAMRERLENDYGCFLNLLGGPPVPDILDELGIKHPVIMVDNLGRAGTATRPMKAHFDANLMMNLAKRGITWGLLPPAGCEANPVELVNGFLQRQVAYAKPDEKYMDSTNSATTLGGCTCQPQLLYLLNKGIEHANNKKEFLQGCYDKRACGARLEELLVGSGAGQAVLALRAKRRELGLPLPQRKLHLATERREVQTVSGLRYNLQSLEELAKQRGGMEMAWRAQLVPWITSEYRFFAALCAVDILNGCGNQTTSKAILERLGHTKRAVLKKHAAVVSALRKQCKVGIARAVADSPHNAHVSVVKQDGDSPHIPLKFLAHLKPQLQHSTLAAALCALFPDEIPSGVDLEAMELAEETGLVHADAIVSRRIDADRRQRARDDEANP